MVNSKKEAEIEVIDSPLGGKIVKIVHPDGSVSAFLRLNNSNRLTKMVGLPDE